MNINKSYFDIPKSNNEKENIDLQKIQHFTLNTFSKNNNTQETIWNFDIKFGYVDTMYENIPLYENSRINPENQNNIGGFTYDGYSYPPFDSNKPKGDIIGYIRTEVSGNKGCSFSNRLKYVKGIKQVRLDIPISIINSFKDFNHIIYLSIDELTGYSHINIPTKICNNKDVSFTLYLVDTNPTHNTYMSSSEMIFDQLINFQKLNIDIFNPFTKFDKNTDRFNIRNARINSNGYLELITNNLHESCAINNILFIPKDKIYYNKSNSNKTIKIGAVIDGYIENAKIIFRTIKGKQINTSLSDSNGLFQFNEISDQHIIACAHGGIDTSYYSPNIIELKAIVNNKNDLYITPITTLITDYLIFKNKNSYILNDTLIENSYQLFSKILRVEYINSDYIKTNNIRAGIVCLQIVSTIKSIYTIINKFSKKNVCISIISTKLAIHIAEKNFSFTNKSNVSQLINDIAKHYNVSISDNSFSQSREYLSKAVTCHNTLDKNDNIDFESLAVAANILQKEIESDNITQYLTNISEVIGKRRVMMGKPIKKPIYYNFKIRLEFKENSSKILKDSISEITYLLQNIILQYNSVTISNLPITIEECCFQNDHELIRTFFEHRLIQINSHFIFDNINTKFITNNPLVTILLKEIIYMIAYNWKQFTKNGFYIGNKGVENYNIITNSYNIYHNYTGIPVDKFNKLTYCDLQPSYPDDIMIHSLTQQSCITIITLGILEDNGYIVNYNSKHLNIPRLFYNNIDVNDNILIEYEQSDNKYPTHCDCIKFAKRIDRTLEIINTNIPVSDKLNFTKIISYNFKNNYTLDLVLDKYINGLVTFIPHIYVDDKLYESLDIQTIKLNKFNTRNISFHFKSLIQLLNNSNFLENIKFEFEFYLGSNKQNSNKCVINTIYSSPYKWKELEDVPQISY